MNVNVFAPGERERERELNGRSRSTAFGSRSESVQNFKQGSLAAELLHIDMCRTNIRESVRQSEAWS